MSQPPSRLDAAFALFAERLNAYPKVIVDPADTLASDNPAGLPGPVRAHTILLGEQPWAILGLTTTAVSPQTPALIAYLARRARARHAPYLLLSNQREAVLLPTPRRDDEAPEPLRRYPLIPAISAGSKAALTPPELIALQQLADQMAADLETLHSDGRLDMILPDADFFVDRLTRAVHVLKPTVKQALQNKLHMAPAFGQELADWAVLQAIPADLRSPDFAEAVVRQAIYRLLGKIIFYQSLRRAVPHLPEMEVASLDTAQVMPRLAHCFQAAHQIDYHAVFREDVVDRLPYPAAASAELRGLITDLNTRDFAHLPQDVVGVVFERLIPPEDRHALGQYFTPEPLVDFIVAFCVRQPDDTVLDATCGTGTFLIRSYDCLKTRLGQRDHRQLLGQLWGADIAPFPAELATINLFRQQVNDAGNFPRILNEDFFNVAPGGTYRFPPLKADAPTGTAALIDEPIPQFAAIVGNFPYISADRIERSVKGYRAKVNRRLAADWFLAYPDGFGFTHKTDAKQHQLAREKGLDLRPFQEKAQATISTFADLYVSLFWHAAAFLQPGGRMGIVTSNAWLDVGYGYTLQRFLLDHFKIIAIVESRVEPWFAQAAVNTIVTIVERCAAAAERDDHPARFVQMKRPLAELIPWDMHTDGLRRWLELEKLRQRLESVTQASDELQQPHTWEDENFQVRLVRQGVLRQQAVGAGQTVKWGPLLRAPQVYFDLRRAAGGKLALLRDVASPSRGSLTGNNEFYHLDEAKIAEWGIEEEFLWPLLKSPGESDRILVDESELRLKVFVCRLSKTELRQQGKLNALRYIEWGEQQKFADGRPWPEGIEVQNRRPGWYALPEYRSRPARIFLTKAYGERHFLQYLPKDLIADQRLYFLSPEEGVDVDALAAVMNSTICAFSIEVTGRVLLGDGALELAVEDARDHLYVPDVRQFDERARATIEKAFQPLLTRPIGSILDEVKRADRQALDRAILQALGLDAALWLPRLYDGLTTLTRQRLQLAQLRGESRRSRPQKAASRVTEDVLQELLPNGPLSFPDAFWSPQARAGAFKEIALPDEPLSHIGHLLGREELATARGDKLHVANKFEARYVLYAQAARQKVARLPETPVELSRTVNNYVHYLRELRQQLYHAYFTRTLDQAAAERFAGEVWRRFNLPEIEQ